MTNTHMITRILVQTLLLLCAGRAVAQPAYGVSASGSALSFLGDIPNDTHSFNFPFTQALSYTNAVHSQLSHTDTFYCTQSSFQGDHTSSGDASADVSIGIFSGLTHATLTRSPATLTCNNQTTANGSPSQAICNASMEFDDTITLSSSTIPAGTTVPFRIRVVADGSLTQGSSAEYTTAEYAPYVQFSVETNYFNPGAITLYADKTTGFFNGVFTTNTQFRVGTPFRIQAVLHFGMSTFYLQGGVGSASTDESVNAIRVYLEPIGSDVHFLSASGHNYSPPATCTPDFNGDGDIGTDADIEAFFACLGGTCCSTCGSADFNGDGDIGTDADIEAFFRVLGGGAC